MAITSIPDAGGDAVPGGYPAPTPHAAVVEQHPYEAPSSVPAGDPPVSNSAGFDAIGGLGSATQL
ncbi:hypothetical protein E2F47_22195 [Mycobacterium eburneum]|nr:hypothetical protein [Mycobacterium eburneum]TDH48879.1 hypothetical protein E2F47_22195 [Mycobacterium eburneum]